MLRGVISVLYFLVILFFVRLVGRALVQLFRGGGGARPAGGRPRPAPKAEELVRDRVCNTYVPRTRALTAVVGGREEHFCSGACRDKARASVPRAS